MAALVSSYARAILNLTAMPRELFETCEHGTAINVECFECEPILCHDPGFD